MTLALRHGSCAHNSPNSPSGAAAACESAPGSIEVDGGATRNKVDPLGREGLKNAFRRIRSLRAGKRVTVIMSWIQSAKLNGHDPYCYLTDVLERLATQPTR